MFDPSGSNWSMRLQLLLLFAVAASVTGGCGRSPPDIEITDTAVPDAGKPNTGIIEIDGSWTFHADVVSCGGGTTPYVTIMLAQRGTTFSFIAPDETHAYDINFNGTIDGTNISFASSSNGIEVPAGDCSYSGAVDPSGTTMQGIFGCECVSGNWTMTR